MAHEVTVMTRQGCHSCAPAVAAARRVCEPREVAVREVDVDSDAELRGEYGDRVPVVLVDGAEHGYWKVDEARLAAALDS